VAIDPQLGTRLELLEGSGQIDADVAGFLRESVPSLATELALPLDDETFGTPMTHTALALQRARRGEAIEEWEGSHADELAAFPQIVAAAEAFATRAETRLDLTLPPQEREFLALHFAALSLRAGGR
jgi:hypothetical protein